MAKLKGKDVSIFIDGLIVGCSKSASISIETSMIDATTKCSKDPDTGVMNTENEPNINTITISGDGLVPALTSGGQPDEYSLSQLVDAQLQQKKVYITYILPGQFLYGADAYLTTTSSDANFDDLVTFSFEATVTGKLNKVPVS